MKMATTKRYDPPLRDGPDAKKTKFIAEEEEEEMKAPQSPPRKRRVILNPADCDLDFNIEGDYLQGSALHEQGFAYCWSGARANVGITSGKYCFGCKIISDQPIVMEDTPPDQQHVCRVGISRGDNAVGNLGETAQSFGFGGTGKFSNAGKFTDYGEKYAVGDTIVCCVDLGNRSMASISFSKNGKSFGVAKHFDTGPSGLGVVDCPVEKLEWESALFPHILLKNVVVQLQFSLEDGLVPVEGYKPWACAIEDGNIIMGPTFSDPCECEVLMMVGLPASGKSTWAEKWVKDHPEKRYIVLGTNLALDLMKVPGLLRKHNYGERFERLMDRATGIFNSLLSRASKINRNFIIDQTNVYKSARKRKLKPFLSYRKIAVVVFPESEELKVRADKRFKEMGKEVPADAVNEMLANFTLPMSKDMPRTDEYFDQVWFVELSRAESQKYLDAMKANLRSKREFSPYCRESSEQPYGSSLTQGPRLTHIPHSTSPSFSPQGSFPGVSTQQPSLYPPQPPLGPPHGSFYSGSSNYAGGNYYSSSSTYTGGNNYSSYGGSDNFRGSGYAARGGVAEPNQNYGSGYPYSNNSLAGRGLVPGDSAVPYQSGRAETYMRPAPYGYGSQGAYGGPGELSPEMSARRRPMFQSTTPIPYGTPYGSQVPRPPNDNFATCPTGPAPHRPEYY